MEHAAKDLVEVCRARPTGKIALALCGGKTPASLYARLARRFVGQVPWDRLEVFFGDERNVAPDDPESNYRLASQSLLAQVPLPSEQVHRFRGESQDLEREARRYEAEIRARVTAGPCGIPAFDLIWLGLGADGHTASLFPKTAALEEERRLVVANEVPAIGARRLTFTFPLLNAARKVQFLVVGAEKALMVRWILGPAARHPSRDLPALRVRPLQGELEWVLDRDAAAGMEESDLIA